ncbi:unnamed protein product [Paramecium pentaurelia]|uniref:Phosphatidylinositol-3,4,5-trisphosphate 3-phosphatase n=1 Tax=Paramecium pentaurelia TaxID=43138 RepID=A0A8S1VUM3_9CILI|nr:unnamed protein product [Paramecium pentaurelia]
MIQMQDIQESMILNYISSDEDDDMESPLINQSPVEIKQKQKKYDQDQSITQIPSELSFNRNMDRRINETIVLQNHADEITLKSTKNAKEAYQREIIKELVSKQKKRFKVDGFNLDLTYITDNVIAMGFPAESFEAIYRNPMPEVQKFLNSRHPNNYMVINLCSERKYKHESFYKVAEFPFDDHQAPPFNMMVEFCQKVHEWLTANSNHVVAIHCKAGKGRTGVMVCCYLLFSGKYTSSQDALAYYGLVRTQNKKGVTIPSQIRYVHYFSYALKNELVKMPFRQIELVSVRLVGVSNGTMIRVQNNDRQLIEKAQIVSDKEILFAFNDIFLQGDVLIQIFHKSIVSESKILQAWFNTNFVSLSPREQVFKAEELDMSKKSMKHSTQIQMELLFDQVIHTRQRSNCLSKGK